MDMKTCPAGVQNHQRLLTLERMKCPVAFAQEMSVRPPYWSSWAKSDAGKARRIKNSAGNVKREMGDVTPCRNDIPLPFSISHFPFYNQRFLSYHSEF